MTKIYCADVSCKYINDKGICTQKKIGLAWSSIMTLYDGRHKYNKCRMYEKSDEARMIEDFIKNHQVNQITEST